MIRKKYLATAALAVIVASPVFAQDDAGQGERPRRNRPDPGAVFDQMDTNKDGKVSEEEFTTAAAKRAQETFKRMDKDGDGSLTKEEFQLPRRPGGPGGPGRPDQGPQGGEGGPADAN